MNEPVKYALVTGASSGIGWHISKELAQRGYSIIAISNQPEQLEELKKYLKEDYPAISVITENFDLSHPGAAKQVFDYCEAQSYNIDVLVNNAGMLLIGVAITLDQSKVAAILQLHINTVAMLCYLFGQKMEAKRVGYILNVSSISAVMPYPIISLYGPSKTFVRYFTRALRTEMKSQGIKVTCLIPGATATALYDAHKVNISLAMKLGIMKVPEIVARAGVKALFGDKAECIPGIMNKVAVVVLRFIPHMVIGWIYRIWLKQRW